MMGYNGVSDIHKHRRAALRGSLPRGREKRSAAWFLCRRDRVFKLAIALILMMFISVNVYLLKGEALRREAQRGNAFTPLIHLGDTTRSTALSLDAEHVVQHLGRELRESDPLHGVGGVGAAARISPPATALCSRPVPCDKDSVAVHVSIGRAAQGSQLLVCFDGKEVDFGEDRGKGIMLMSADPATLSVRTRVFSTGTSKSASDDLIDYLGNLPKDTIVVMAADGARAAPLLSDAARHAIYSTGSGMVHVVDDDHAWAMATVKGLALSTPYEAVAPSLAANSKENVAQVSTCVPKNIYLAVTNIQQRKVVCRTQGSTEPNKYGNFCSDTAIAEYLLPAKGPNPGGSVAVGLPVTILARHNRPDYLQQCLSSLFTNPGLNLSQVTVYVDSYSPDVHALLNLFAVRARFFPKTVTTSTMKEVHRKADMITAHYARVLPLAWASFPTAVHMVVLEEDHTVAPDFLYFFAQLIPTVDKDPSVMAVSAYNDNGYKHEAQDAGIVYRSDFFPGRAWLLPLRSWEGWRLSFPQCCGGWSWDLWLRDPPQRKDRETLIPDVPRAHHIGERGMQVSDYYWKVYFQPAVLNANPRVKLRELDTLTKDAYEEHLHRLIRSALQLPVAGGSRACGADMVPNSAFGMRYVLFYEQRDATDSSQLQKLAKCFKIWDLGVRGAHNGVLRFHSKFNHILLVGAKTTYGKALMPTGAVPFTVT
eukprot:scpid28444/ scgid6635/ Protein O-linked-mannose beta-1,2-N-acetylglucosaminyltransferase 1